MKPFSTVQLTVVNVNSSTKEKVLKIIVFKSYVMGPIYDDNQI